MSEQLDAMKTALMTCAMSRMNNLDRTNAEELGEVIDMIKDIEEAKYYCTITKSMEERTSIDETQSKIDNAIMMDRLKQQAENSYNGSSYYGGPHVRYPDRSYDDYGRMYYDGRDNPRGGMNEKSYTQPNYNTSFVRDTREGKSYMSRKGYVESKDSHMPDSIKMEKLNEYVKELGDDLVEMIRDASPSEKTVVKEKLEKIAAQIV